MYIPTQQRAKNTKLKAAVCNLHVYIGIGSIVLNCGVTKKIISRLGKNCKRSMELGVWHKPTAWRQLLHDNWKAEMLLGTKFWDK